MQFGVYETMLRRIIAIELRVGETRIGEKASAIVFLSV